HAAGLVGDAGDRGLLGRRLHGTAKGDDAVDGDDLDVLGVRREVVLRDHGLANLLRDGPVGLASTLIHRRQGLVTTVSDVALRIVRVRGGADLRHRDAPDTDRRHHHAERRERERCPAGAHGYLLVHRSGQCFLTASRTLSTTLPALSLTLPTA